MVCQLVEKFPAFFQLMKFIFLFTRACPYILKGLGKLAEYLCRMFLV
jgi:hypothetical protein